MKAGIVLGLLSGLSAGCSREDPLPPPSLPEITSGTEEGFADLTFRLQDHRTEADGSQRMRASGLHQGRKLGFEISLARDWKKGTLKSVVTTFSGIVQYHSIGPESDALLQTLDQLYGAKLTPKAMNRETRFAGISLEGDPGNLQAGPVKIKLFFESESEGRYAELFTNIDLKGRTIQVREKDPDYRAPIIRALQAP